MKKNSTIPLLVIIGETGSGKSRLAMKLARLINDTAVARLESVSARGRDSQAIRTGGTVMRELSGRKPKMAKKPAELSALLTSRLAGLEGAEIISADSRTIYKGMDIGTAKPTSAEQKQIAHHLLDLVEPNETFNVADFKRLALQAIGEIRERGNLPIMVGGTGLYVDAVIFDYQFRVKYDDKIRQALEAKSVDELITLALEQGIAPGDIDKNKRHLIRLLEAGPSGDSDRQKMIDDVVLVGLGLPRAQLRRSIATRVETMFRRGLKREVETLAERFGWQSEAMSGIGYREFEAYFYKRASLGEVKRQIVQHTLNLAKRQRTWLKRNQFINWFDSAEAAERYVLHRLSVSAE